LTPAITVMRFVFKRAGADGILSYFALAAAQFLRG
jgi:delta-aminolevulinic acid dehydratase/porphobilinogen synthase